MVDKPEIVLASNSSRRREILEHLGLHPKIIVSDADESVDMQLPPDILTTELAERKLNAVKNRTSDDEIVLAADTVVEKDGVIFGKPATPGAAFNMLKTLSGTTHSVVSGIAVSYRGKTFTSSELTKVTFRKIDDSEILAYIKSGEPFDKAGGYGIQDKASVFVKKINGDYFNVVGLPVFGFFNVLRNKFGIDPFSFLSR